MPEAVIPLLIDLASAAVFVAETVGLSALLTVGSLVVGAEQRQAAAKKARNAYNASLTDHQVMIRSAIAPRNIIYGRDKTSGPLPFVFNGGDKGQYLYLVVVLAAHECDAIEQVFFNETEVVIDADGFVRTGVFAKGKSSHETTAFTGTTITLPYVPSSIVAVTRVTGTSFDSPEGGGSGLVQASEPVDPAHYTLSGATLTFSTSDSYTINYEHQQGTPLVRIRKHLGQPGQVADPEFIAESNGKWTEAHVGHGICYLAVRLEYDQDVFSSIGVPTIKGVVRGKRLRDPRTGQTVWSENAALCTADYMLDQPLGMGFDADSLPDAELIAAANIADEDVDLDGTATQKRYTIHGSLSTEAGRRSNLEAMLAPMAGTAVWVQGRWLLRAGAYRTPEWTLDESWLAQGTLTTVPRTKRSELFNAVTGTFVDPTQGYVEVPFPDVLNPTYEAEDGNRRVKRNVPMPFVDGAVRAQRVGKIQLERARQALTIKLTCNLKAYDTVPTQTGLVNLARYGFAGKLFEVRERGYDPDSRIVTLTLCETGPGVWDWNHGEATTVDLAPNTTLPDPFAPPQALTGLGVATGSAHLLVLADGSLVTRGLVFWDESPNVYVQSGGWIEIEWKLDSATAWQAAAPVSGDSTSTYISPLDDRRQTIVRARAVTALGKAGPWASVLVAVEGKTDLPVDVAGFGYEFISNGVQLSWTPNGEPDYAATELHLESTWSDATPPLFRGKANTWTWPDPPVGAHTVKAKHIDSSGNRSLGAASLSIVIVAGEPGGGHVVDLRPPPTPTGFVVGAGISFVSVQTALPTFSEGGGYKRTVIYAAQWPATQPTAPVFSAASAVGDFQGTYGTFASDPATRWRVWAKWETLDGVQSDVAAGESEVVSVKTAPDVTKLQEALQGAITRSQLFVDLGAPFDALAGQQDAAAASALAAALQAHDEATARAEGLLNEARDRGTAITDVRRVVDSGDAQLAQQILTLTAVVGGNAAVLQQESTTRADADSAEALARQTLAAQVNDATTGLPATRALLVQEATTRADADSAEALARQTLAAQVNDATTGLPATRALLVQEATTRADADSAEALARQTLAAQVNDATTGLPATRALLVQEATTRADADSAEALARQTLAAQVNDATTGLPATRASLEVEAAVRAEQSGYLYGKFEVKLDLNGAVSGFGLMSEASVDAAPSSQFAVRANRFFVVAPTDFTSEAEPTATAVGQLWFQPSTKTTRTWDGTAWGAFRVPQFFTVQTTPTIINGVPVPAGMYSDGAYIVNLTAMIANLGEAWIDSAMVREMSVSKLTAGTFDVGAYAQSTSFALGLPGWRLDNSGIYAYAGSIGGIVIDPDWIGTSNYVADLIGWRADNDGTFHLPPQTRLINPVVVYNAGPLPSFSGSATQVVLSGTAAAALSLLSNGQIQRTIGTTSTIVGNWYLPTTTGIGSSYTVVAASSGDAITDPTRLNRELALSSTVSWALQKTGPVGEKHTVVQVSVFTTGGTLVGSGVFNLNAIFDA